MQTARTKALTYLRNEFWEEWRALYVSEKQREPLNSNTSYLAKRRRNTRAQSRASLKLKAKYPETYHSLRQLALSEGYPATWRP